MENKKGIYCIECIIDKKKYIGSSINVYKRRNRHFSELKNNKHKNIKLQRSYNKYGKDAFIFYILEFIERGNDLIIKEQQYIDNEKPFFNINLIANSSLGVRRSNDTKEKIKLANLGLKHPEWRNKIKSESQGGDKHWTKNKKFSNESKKKMSESQKKLYINGYISPLKGVKLNNERVEKLRDTFSKPILMFDLEGNLIREFKSAKEAHKMYGFHVGYISQCCRLKIKKYKGYVWKFKQ